MTKRKAKKQTMQNQTQNHAYKWQIPFLLYPLYPPPTAERSLSFFLSFFLSLSHLSRTPTLCMHVYVWPRKSTCLYRRPVDTTKRHAKIRPTLLLHWTPRSLSISTVVLVSLAFAFFFFLEELCMKNYGIVVLIRALMLW
jgi:hypothetical protein